jgi:methyltransferase-like protein
MVREMLLYHTENAPEPQTKIAQGRALLKFLAEGHGSDDDYGTMLKTEAERVLTFDANHFYHDDLADLNQPFYLHEFVAQAGAKGLQYLGDADYSSMHELRYPKQVRDVLSGIGDDWVRKEQYLDFLKCRRFRQTLLCRQEVKIEREVPLELMREFVFSSSARPVEDGAELRDDSMVDFAGEGSLKLRTGHPVAKLCTAFLGMRFPARVSADELRAVVSATLGCAPEPEQIEAVLLEFLKLGTAEAHLSAGSFTTDPGDKPKSSAWARYQAKLGGGVTTLRHQTVHVRDEFGLWLLGQLDGTHTAEEIAVAMARTVEPTDGIAPDLEKETAQAAELVTDGLRQLGKLGLLECQK